MHNSQEEWKDCFGYEGLYQISNYGNIKSLDKLVWNRFKYIKRLGRDIKTNIDKYGYVRATLSKNGKRTNEQIHRLVAKTFLDNPNNYPQINHKDCNKQNNYVGNLEWCTNAHNMKHAFNNIDFDYQTRPVLQIENNVVIAKYDSIQDASKSVNDNPTNILRACNFDNDSSKGYRWRFDIGKYEIGDYINLPTLYHPSTKKRKVVQIKDGIIIAIFDSIMDAARHNNCTDSAISMCCKGKIHNHHGYKWMYFRNNMRIGDIAENYVLQNNSYN